MGLSLREETPTGLTDKQWELIAPHWLVRNRRNAPTQEGSALRYFIAEERLEFSNPVFYQ